MTAVDKLDWELRVRENGGLRLCGMRETSLGEQTLVQMSGTNAELRASLYRALALLGDDGSQGRPPANADELQRTVISAEGVGGGGGARVDQTNARVYSDTNYYPCPVCSAPPGTRHELTCPGSR